MTFCELLPSEDPSVEEPLLPLEELPEEEVPDDADDVICIGDEQNEKVHAKVDGASR